MQGMAATPGLVAHWVVPPRLASDIKWLICYVTLSRVPSLKQLVSIGLSDKIREILEAGPPEGMVQMFSTLFADKIEETRAAALRAKQNLGWRLPHMMQCCKAWSLCNLSSFSLPPSHLCSTTKITQCC